jgi:hypothetical protein
VVPTKSWKRVAALPGVYVKVTLVPDSVVPGAGVVSAAGVGMVYVADLTALVA